MAELSTLARPYAKAAFEHAADAGQLDGWLKALNLQSALVSEERVGLLLSSPSYTPTQQAEALINLCSDSLDASQKNFILVLSEHRRLPLLPEVASQFAALKANREKSVDVEVISAGEITEDQQQKLASALSSKLEREVGMKVTIDSSLIGGAIVRAGDTVIDGSIRGRLAKLAEAINL